MFFVCLRATIYPELRVQSFTNDHLAQSSSGGVAMRLCAVLLVTDDVIFAHSWPYILHVDIDAASDVRSLHCRAQANAPAASYWLRHVLDDGGRG